MCVIGLKERFLPEYLENVICEMEIETISITTLKPHNKEFC